MYATRTNPKPATRRRKSRVVVVRASRRGFASGLVLLMLVFLAGFIALGLNVSRLTQVQTQLRTVCQAAALAGAAELLDEGFLAGAADQRDDVAAAREAALAVARTNFVDGRPVVLNPNSNNAPLGDIVVGSIEPLAVVGRPLALPIDPKQAQGMNTVRVTARLSLNTYNKVTLFCGALLGVLHADAAANAQATLDRRIAGFRPEPGVRVPVVPLVADYEPWMKQATARSNATNDRYTVNYRTGEVTAGADGIPEITVSTALPQAAAQTDDATEPKDAAEETTDDKTDDDEIGSPPPAWCRALALPTVDTQSGTGPSAWSVRCRRGLSIADLAPFGGQLIVMPQGFTTAPTLPTLPTEVPYELMEIVGASRAWPLAEAGSDPSSCAIVGFAAGRIVAVRRISSTTSTTDDWEIIVQPTTLVCSQAVTTANMGPNPWIGKLELTQ